MNICKLTLHCIAMYYGIWAPIINHTQQAQRCVPQEIMGCVVTVHIKPLQTDVICVLICQRREALTNRFVKNLFLFVLKLLGPIELSCISAESEVFPKGLYFGPPKLLCPWYRPQVNPRKNPIKQTSPPSPGHLVQRSPANSINPNHWGNLSGPASGTVPGFRLNMTDYSIWA